MDFLVPRELQIVQPEKELERCNHLIEACGLTLTTEQMRALGEARVEALRRTDRVEFGEGILKKADFCLLRFALFFLEK